MNPVATDRPGGVRVDLSAGRKESGTCESRVREGDPGKVVLPAGGRAPELRRRTILVHSCCGPCSASVVERLARDAVVTLFFYNPNITDEDEYRRRLDAQRAFVEIFNSSPNSPSRVGLIVGPYDPGVFYRICEGYEEEPEGGARCERCISMRMVKTAEFASLHGFDCFTTTLSVSPHKNHSVIAAIGNRLRLQYGVDFLADDFREYGGYARSVELSRMYGLYRQTYCGCGFARDAGVSNAKTSDVKTRGGGAGCGDAGRDTEEPSPCAPEVFGGRARKMRM